MSDSPSVVGARAEREVAFALERVGWQVYLPMFASHARVDLVALRGEECIRVQCKTSRYRKGVLLFRACSNTANNPKSYHGEIDVFGVYSPEFDRVYVVPVGHTKERLCSLRIDPTINNQQKGVRLAADYEL